MTLDEAIRNRRAVRAFTPEPVGEETIRRLLKAAVQAPTAMNAQPWIFSIVQDVAQLKRYSEHAKAMLLEKSKGDAKVASYAERLRDNAFNIFYDASTLIVIGVAKTGPYTDADCWLAAENLMLSAVDAGLGTCCIGFALPLLNTIEVKLELHVPPPGAVVAALIVGHPRVSALAVPRAEPRIVSWTRSDMASR